MELETQIDFSPYNVFFLGEFHGVYGISEIKLALIKYLNQKNGIKDVFMEIGQSAAWLYNKYLETGDTSLFTSPVIIYSQKTPNREFWRNLYKYNKGLKDKIVIHGMDFERIEFIKVLKLLSPTGKEKPKEIKDVLTLIDTFRINEVAKVHSPESKRQNDLYESLRENMDKFKSIYEDYYGSNFKTVSEIMFNEDTYRNFADRDRTMYNNILKQVKRAGIRKFLILGGLRHGNNSYTLHRSLWYLLEKTKGFRNKTANISMVCKNCFDWQSENKPGDMAFRAQNNYLKDTVMLNDIYRNFFNPSCKYSLLPSISTGQEAIINSSNFILLMKDQFFND